MPRLRKEGERDESLKGINHEQSMKSINDFKEKRHSRVVNCRVHPLKMLAYLLYSIKYACLPACFIYAYVAALNGRSRKN